MSSALLCYFIPFHSDTLLYRCWSALLPPLNYSLLLLHSFDLQHCLTLLYLSSPRFIVHLWPMRPTWWPYQESPYPSSTHFCHCPSPHKPQPNHQQPPHHPSHPLTREEYHNLTSPPRMPPSSSSCFFSGHTHYILL